MKFTTLYVIKYHKDSDKKIRMFTFINLELLFKNRHFSNRQIFQREKESKTAIEFLRMPLNQKLREECQYSFWVLSCSIKGSSVLIDDDLSMFVFRW